MKQVLVSYSIPTAPRPPLHLVRPGHPTPRAAVAPKLQAFRHHAGLLETVVSKVQPGIQDIRPALWGMRFGALKAWWCGINVALVFEAFRDLHLASADALLSHLPQLPNALGLAFLYCLGLAAATSLLLEAGSKRGTKASEVLSDSEDMVSDIRDGLSDLDTGLVLCIEHCESLEGRIETLEEYLRRYRALVDGLDPGRPTENRRLLSAELAALETLEADLTEAVVMATDMEGHIEACWEFGPEAEARVRAAAAHFEAASSNLEEWVGVLRLVAPLSGGIQADLASLSTCTVEMAGLLRAYADRLEARRELRPRLRTVAEELAGLRWGWLLLAARMKAVAGLMGPDK